MRETGLSKYLIEYLNHGKTIYGISAGAIVMGAHINTASIGPERDENLVGIMDCLALNVLNKAIVATHYVAEMNKALFKMSKQDRRKIICIPETSGVFVYKNKCKVLGFDPVTIIDSGKKRILNKGRIFKI